MVLGVFARMARTMRHRLPRAGRTKVPYGQMRKRFDSHMVNFSPMRWRLSLAHQTLERLGGSQHLVGVPIDLDAAPDPLDPAVGPDQHRGAKNALEGSAIHGLFAPRPIRAEHLTTF